MFLFSPVKCWKVFARSTQSYPMVSLVWCPQQAHLAGPASNTQKLHLPIGISGSLRCVLCWLPFANNGCSKGIFGGDGDVIATRAPTLAQGRTTKWENTLKKVVDQSAPVFPAFKFNLNSVSCTARHSGTDPLHYVLRDILSYCIKYKKIQGEIKCS